MAEIERQVLIKDQCEKDLLWDFYDGIFQPINQQTPFVQSFPKKDFLRWLDDPNVVKFSAKDKGRIVGLGIVTEEIDLEPLLSPAYFRKHYPDAHFLYCPVVAVAPTHKGKGVAIDLIRLMLCEGKDNTALLFLHSKAMSLGVPRLFSLSGAGRIEGKEIDAEACWLFRWKGGKKMWPEDLIKLRVLPADGLSSRRD